MKTYDAVKNILMRDERARNSDQYLMWEFWVEEEKATNGEYTDNAFRPGRLYQNDFMGATSPGSIGRARRKIQEKFPGLRPTSEKVKISRAKKEKTKSTFVYRENVQQKIFT